MAAEVAGINAPLFDYNGETNIEAAVAEMEAQVPASQINALYSQVMGLKHSFLLT